MGTAPMAATSARFRAAALPPMSAGAGPVAPEMPALDEQVRGGDDPPVRTRSTAASSPMPTIASGAAGSLAAMAAMSPNSPSSPMLMPASAADRRRPVCGTVTIPDWSLVRRLSPPWEDVMVHAYILVQTEVGKAAEVACRIAKIAGVTQAEDVTGPYDVIVRAEADNVDDLGRLVVAQIQGVRDHPDPHLPGRALLTSSCGAIAAVRGAEPQPGRRAQVGRSVHVPAQPGDAGQIELGRARGPVPPSRSRAEPRLEPAPGRRRVQRRPGCRPRRARTPRASPRRRAGPGPARPAAARAGPRRARRWRRPGGARRRTRGAVHERRVQAVARLVGDHVRAQPGQLGRRSRVVADHDHRRHLPAADRRRDGVGRQGQGELGPARSGQAGQPGLGLGKYLDGDHQRPRERCVNCHESLSGDPCPPRAAPRRQARAPGRRERRAGPERQAAGAERGSIAGGYATGRERSHPGAGARTPAGRGAARRARGLTQGDSASELRSCLDMVRGEPRDWPV